MAKSQQSRWSGASGASGVPEPPWRQSRKPARTPLTREVIVDAALRILDAQGMDGLSMRRVSEALGAGAASLYWHVRNKDELFQLIFERVSQEAELPDPDPSRWQEQLRELAARMRTVLNSHRDVARLSLGRIPSGPMLAIYSEWLFTLLRPVGIPDGVIAKLGDFFSLYVTAYAFEETLGLLSSPAGGDATPEQFFTMLRDYLLSLPPDQFPHTSKAVDLLFEGGPDERYEFGIDLILRGLSTYAKEPPG